MMRSFTRFTGLLLLAAQLLLPRLSLAQMLTQADFTAVVVPQYMNSGTAARVPVAFRATVANLTPNTLYRYYTQGGIASDLGAANSGAGNPLLITPGATPAATTYAYTSSASLTVVGGYNTFTTNASGSFTGWFAFLNTGNVRFTAGNVVYPTITLATDAVPATVVKRLALNQTLTVLALGTGTTANDATGFKGSSSATPKNLVAVYNNTDGTGRPLSVTVVEAIAATGSAVTGVPTYYTSAAGDWNTIIPNVLPTGVRRVEQRSVVDGSVVGCASDADGIWPSGTNTVNPASGPAALALTATDAPLNTSACGSVVTTPTVAITPAGPLTFTTALNTASATQTISVSGSNLTGAVTVTAPAGYEVATVAAGPFTSTITLGATGGTQAATSVFVRLASAATAGTPSGALTATSAGATTASITLNGTVSAPTTTPTLTATPAGPLTYTSTAGTASATQTVTVSGSNLGATVQVTAPAAYEIATTEAGPYTATITLTATGGTLAATPVFVRLAATAAAGARNGALLVASTGATDVSVLLNGMVSAVAAAPTITSIAPATGPVGTVVTITGTSFTGVTAVTLNGVAIPATGYTVVNATTITFTVPAGAATGAVAVTTGGGTATSTTGFTVTVPSTPTISTLSPARAVVGGPAFVLTVGGTNLSTSSQLSFRGQTYTAATATAAGTSATFAIPASDISTLGTFKVTVTNGGTASGTLDFTVVPAPTTVAFEDFEQGTKGSYTAADVTLRSGVWTFTDALIGDLFNDRVNQAKGARVRGGGSIAMKFDKPNGAGVITILAANYGNDTGVGVKAEISADGGLTYTEVPGAATNPAALTKILAPYTFTANKVGNVRVRFTSTATGTTRTSFDDVTITDFVSTATRAGQALPGLAVFPNPTRDLLTVALPKAGAARVALRDLTGRVVLASAALPASGQLRLPATLAAGTYLLEVQQGTETAVRRIVKE